MTNVEPSCKFMNHVNYFMEHLKPKILLCENRFGKYVTRDSGPSSSGGDVVWRGSRTGRFYGLIMIYKKGFFFRIFKNCLRLVLLMLYVYNLHTVHSSKYAQKSKKPEILYGHIIILYSDPFGHFKSAVLVNNGYIW